MIAHRRADVADLNERARARLRDEGRLGADVLVTERGGFAIGDRVVATRNDARIGVVNGQAGTLVGFDGEQLSMRTDRGDEIDLPRRYVERGHLAHGYSITAHRAQGATVDRTFVLGSDELYREWGYAALSRHTEEARFYVTATPQFLNAPARPIENPAEAVARQLTDSRAQDAAITFRPAVDPILERRQPDRGRGLER